MNITLKNKSFIKPVLMSMVFFTACFLSAAFIQKSDEWKAPDTAKEKKNPIATDETSVAAGKKAYEKECLNCHGKKGKGDGANAATLEKEVGDLTLAKAQNQTDGELFWKISEGRKPMPIGKKTLSEEQRWQVVNYIRTFKKK